jgi:hypothetical protein
MELIAFLVALVLVVYVGTRMIRTWGNGRR